MTCTHIGIDPRQPCPHPPVGETGLCLWHNPQVSKRASYVRDLFLQADARGVGFREANLVGIDLSTMTLPGRMFQGADLRDAVLDRSDLHGADLSETDLRRANFSQTDCRDVNFINANLTGVNFAGADLRGADLRNAILDGASMLGADLRNADLTGARISELRWNRLTRFQGIKGWDGAGTAGADDGDSTQVFLAPSALPDLDTPQIGEAGAEELRTRIFRIGRTPGARAQEMPPQVAGSDLVMEMPLDPLLPPRRRWPGLIIPALVGAALVAGAWGVANTRKTAEPASQVPALAREIDGLKKQREADLEQLRQAQERATHLADQVASLRQAGSAAESSLAQRNAELREALTDLGRLRDADDRAAALRLKVGELDVLNRDLAGATARQDRVSKILADGVDRFRSESEKLAKELTETRTRATTLEKTQGELIRTRQELAQVRQERDSLTTLYQSTHADLASAKQDLERYLARITASQLQGLLSDDTAAPLMPITSGAPISLGGDYLVTLQVDPGSRAGNLDVKLVIQRPSAVANPDATVVLYDQNRKPLRRLSYSFPHVDAGNPFVSAAATLACDRPPKFARIILAPGIEEVATK